MNAERLGCVMDWLKTTDLMELRYQDGSGGFELRVAQAAAAPPSAGFSNRYIPVCAPAVGLFQPNEPGHPRLGEEGLAVKEGDVLGLVETGVGRPHIVRAPGAGRVARVFIEGGKAVQYGQPLFFLERG